MKINNRRKISLIMMLILCIGIGYATLSTNLSITGLNVFKGNTWDVHLENVIDKSFTTDTSHTTGVISQNGKSITYNVSFTNPGESYIFYVDVVNDGTLDAMLDTFTATVSEEAEDIIDIDVTYLDDVELTRYDLLSAGESDKLKIQVRYKHGDELQISDLPDEDTNFTVTFTVNYLQSDEHALARDDGTLDEDAPIIQNMSVTPGEHSINIQVNGYDEESGVMYYYSKDNGVSYVSSPSPNYTFTNVSDNDYTIKAYLKDMTGNQSLVLSGNTTVSTIYAVYYDDKTLVLNHTGNINENKTISKNYGNIADKNSVTTKVENIGNTSVVSYEYSEQSWFDYSTRQEVLIVDIEDTIKPINLQAWFDSGHRITEFQHFENLDTSKTITMRNMFNGYLHLPELDLSHFDTSRVVDMSGMFRLNESLTNIIFGENWDTSNVKNMSEMFYDVRTITTIDVSNWNVSNVTNMSRMFTICSKLNGLDLSKWDTRNVTYFSSIFSYGTSSNATNKEWFYGDNSSNLVQYKNSDMTFTYKAPQPAGQ